jgi:Cu/Ag efflux pump CusA
MTSMAFILGVLPLVTSNGAGSEMRRAVGTAVFSGMLGVTLFGLLFTPVFYVVVRRISREPVRVVWNEPPSLERRRPGHEPMTS